MNGDLSGPYITLIGQIFYENFAYRNSTGSTARTRSLSQKNLKSQCQIYQIRSPYDVENVGNNPSNANSCQMHEIKLILNIYFKYDRLMFTLL